MGLLNVIRRMALREQLPIREIARRTGLSRNTIRKYLKSGAVEPTFATPERPSKLDLFAEKLAGWLKTEASKGRKQRRTLKQLHADLVALGFTGSYNRVAAFAREWRDGRQREEQTAGRGTFVPLFLCQPRDILTHLSCKIGIIRLACWERKDMPMPRVLPLRQDIPSDELRRRAKQETDGRAARRMLATNGRRGGGARRHGPPVAARPPRPAGRVSCGDGGKGLLTFAGRTASTRQASIGCTIGRIPAGRRG